MHTLTVKFREALEDVIGCRNDEGAGAVLSRGSSNPFAHVDSDNSNSLAGNNTNGEDPPYVKSITKVRALLSDLWQFSDRSHCSSQCWIAGHLSLFICVCVCVGVCEFMCVGVCEFVCGCV